MIWEEILMLAVGNGLWAVLSCVLLMYLLKDSKKREEKYTGTIDALAERLKVVVRVSESQDKLFTMLAAKDIKSGAKEKKQKVPGDTAYAAGAAESGV